MNDPANIFNFGAGPAMMPTSVLEQLAEDIINYKTTGMSVAELSHRAKEYMEIFADTRDSFKELLNVPDDYEIIFTSGGASSEFGNIVRNLMSADDIAAYINTGYWSNMAFKTAKKFQDDGLVGLIADIDGLDKKNGLVSLRKISIEEFTPNPAYAHITANETIGGIQYQKFPDTGYAPLVADMSSELFTREFDFSDFGLVYACAQKNFGFAGFSVVITKKKILREVLPGTLDIENYAKLAENDSAINTPATVAVYTAGLVADYIKEKGGVREMASQAKKRSSLIYEVIDNSNGFYKNPVHPDVRSKVNIPFILPEELKSEFEKEAADNGLLTLGGHRSIGGLRASMYIGMPIKGAERLAEFMIYFADKKR